MKRFLKIIIALMIMSACTLLAACGGGEEPPVTVSVSYTLDGGKLPSDAPKSFEADEIPDFKNIVPEKKNYDFAGWYTDKKLETAFDVDTIIGTELKLYAKWIPKEFIITYELDGGECEGLPEYHVYGESTSLADFTPTKSGFIFGGWYLNEDFTLSGVILEEGTAEATTVYAKWIPAPAKLGEIPDVTKGYFGSGFSTVTLDLTQYVNANGSTLTYKAESSAPDVATVYVKGSTLEVIMKKATGTADITVSVSVGETEYLTYEFTATPKTYASIACVGDSLTESDPAYPFKLASLFGLTIENYGKSGASISDFTNNDSYGSYKTYGQSQYESSLTTQADLIIIMFGTNDATKIEGGSPKFDWNTVRSAYKAAYRELINEYKALNPDVEIVLMTSPPVLEENMLSISNDIIKNEVNKAQRELAEELGLKLIDLHPYMAERSDLASLYRTNDGVHFNDEGATAIAQFVAKHL